MKTNSISQVFLKFKLGCRNVNNSHLNAQRCAFYLINSVEIGQNMDVNLSRILITDY